MTRFEKLLLFMLVRLAFVIVAASGRTTLGREAAMSQAREMEQTLDEALAEEPNDVGWRR